jgi:Protein of unknown function (DUF3574)
VPVGGAKRSSTRPFNAFRCGGFRFAAPALLLLAGCMETGVTTPPSYACLLAAEQRMLVAELFFGRNVPDRPPLSDAEWADFAAQTVTPNFPDGFTVTDGDGQWQNPVTGRIARERTKILLVAAKRQPDLASRLSAVIEAYKSRFHQQSVGVITRDSCAAF